MPFAMDQQTIAALRYVHGAFNLTVFGMAIVLALRGFRVRKSRLAGRVDSGAARVHRRLGPIVLSLVWTGYSAGTILIFIDKGRILEYPYHGLAGLTLGVLLAVNFLVSRHLTLVAGDIRNIHHRVGRIILVLFAAQVFLGVGILL